MNTNSISSEEIIEVSFKHGSVEIIAQYKKCFYEKIKDIKDMSVCNIIYTSHKIDKYCKCGCYLGTIKTMKDYPKPQSETNICPSCKADTSIEIHELIHRTKVVNSYGNN